MKQNEDYFLRILLAVIPLMSSIFPFQKGLLEAVIVVLAFWFSSMILRFIHLLIPKELKIPAMIIWVAACVQSLGYWLSINIFWGVSLYLLLMHEQEDKKTKTISSKTHQNRNFALFMKKIFFEGAGFLILAAFIILGSELLGGMLSLSIFKQPAGTFLLLAASALFWYQRPVLSKAERST